MGRRKRRDAQAADAMSGQVPVAELHARAVLVDAIAHIESRFSRDLEQSEQRQLSTLLALDALKHSASSSAEEVTRALEELTHRFGILVEQLEADAVDRRALTEAIRRLVRPLDSTWDEPSHVIGGTVLSTPAAPSNDEISLLDEPDHTFTLREGNLPEIRLVGGDSPETLTNRANIAMITGECGDLREALRLCRELLRDQTQVLGPDHPATLTNRANIAAFTAECGYVREALRLCRELLPDRVGALGADHPDTLTTRSDIVVLTAECGEVDEALKLGRALLADRVRVLGASHPDTLTTRNDVAVFMGQCGEVDEALRLCRAVLADRKRVLGANHPDTLATADDINELESTVVDR